MTAGSAAASPDRTERDLRTILRIQAIRAFLYGLGSVLIGVTLADGGLSDAQVGLVFTAMLVGMAVSSVIVGTIGERIGRRRAYVGLLVLVGVAGSVFALTHSLPALIAVSLTGALSTDPNESGPITSLEQAMIGQAPAAARLRVFGRYNAIAYVAGAGGALAASLPSLLGIGDQRALLAYPALTIVAVALAARMTSVVEAAATDAAAGDVRAATRAPLVRSKGIVLRLSALFALDAFGGGFVVQSFVVFWFERTFGVSTQVMAVVFFATGLLQAASSLAAARVAARFGMLNTMVFTHLPSNVLLMLVPFAPAFGAAVVIWLARVAISQMDVPARQAYVVTLVDPSERVAASAYTNTARYVARPIAPAIAGSLMQTAASAPFLIAGGLKIVYDVLLFATFRSVDPPDG
jgi:predicted MFS family arabinose efflux permease